MKKWEHMIAEPTEEQLLQVLDFHSDNGWELIWVEKIGLKSVYRKDIYYRLFFKREKE